METVSQNSLRLFLVVACSCIAVIVRGKSTSQGCEADYFWDDATDKCESCSSYCWDYEERGTKQECQELCPDYMQRWTEANVGIRPEESSDSESSESSSSLPISITVIAVLALVVVLGGIHSAALFCVKRRWARMNRNGQFNTPPEQGNRKYPQLESGELGPNRLAPGRSTRHLPFFLRV